MYIYVIEGGSQLKGEITISGAKNAAVAILPATALVNGVCRVENLPKISDVTLLLEILRNLGAKIRIINDNTIEIDSRNIRVIRDASSDYDLVRQIRASYYLIGAFLGRFGEARVAMPGGCYLGVRPIDQHIKGFEALGANVSIVNGVVHAEAPGRLKGCSLYLDVVSVGATINIMLAAVLADGLTVIENCAREPHIVDVANFLNSMGAEVRGAGTDVIRIKGVTELRGGSYSIIPDQIEAGTYMAMVMAAGGDLVVNNVIPKHLECITAKLQEIGAEIEEYDDAVRVVRRGELMRSNIKTQPYPGFPTDMQPQIAAVLAAAKGTSIITENIWDDRYRYVDELKRMGANIKVDGRIAVVEGVSRLSGAPVQACDLRAGAALITAALAAEGTTEIDNIFYIERGYEGIVDKLSAVGANIKRVEVEESKKQKQA